MLSLVFLLVISAACTTVGQRFEIAKADSFQPGVTSEADARALLGEPASVDTNPNNHHHLLVWEYVTGNALGTGSGSVLAVSFDENGRMLAIVRKTTI